MGDEETPESSPDSDETLPRFNRGYYSVGRGYAYTRTEGSNYPTDHIGGTNDGVVGVYVKAHKGEYTKDPAARILREQYFSHDVSIKVRFK